MGTTLIDSVNVFLKHKVLWDRCFINISKKLIHTHENQCQYKKVFFLSCRCFFFSGSNYCCWFLFCYMAVYIPFVFNAILAPYGAKIICDPLPQTMFKVYQWSVCGFFLFFFYQLISLSSKWCIICIHTTFRSCWILA